MAQETQFQKQHIIATIRNRNSCPIEGFNMEIGWINDFKIGEMSGGNNATCEMMIAEGRKRGHKIIELSPKELPDEKCAEFNALKQYDLLILNNINMFKTEIIEKIIKDFSFMKYEHDYCFCQFRNARCDGCKIKCEPAKIFKELFANSKLNVFFSPLQKNIFKEFFGETMRDAICIPAPINKDLWHPDKNIQHDAYLYAGIIMQHKGVQQILDFADTQKDKVFHFAGKAIDNKLLKQIKNKHVYLGEIKHSEMPRLLRKYKYFIINPQMPESFGLSICEAILSGCSIIKFEKSFNMGMESYDMPITDIVEKCSKAPETFWKEVEKIDL